MPFHHAAVFDRQECELTFYDYNRVIKGTGDTAAKFTTDYTIEFQKVTEPG